MDSTTRPLLHYQAIRASPYCQSPSTPRIGNGLKQRYKTASLATSARRLLEPRTCLYKRRVSHLKRLYCQSRWKETFSRQSFAPVRFNSQTTDGHGDLGIRFRAKNPSDNLLSFDNSKEYHHFCLNPDIRNWFLFVVDNPYFCSIALQVGWKISPYYFKKLMWSFVRYVRLHRRLRLQTYIYDFLIAMETSSSCLRPATALRRFSEIEACNERNKQDVGMAPDASGTSVSL